MRKQSGLIFLFCISALACGEEAQKSAKDTCFTEKTAVIEAYKKTLDDVSGNTAQFFNLKFLASEMQENGVPSEQIGERLIGYISTIDERQNGVDVEAAYASCTESIAKVVLKGAMKGTGAQKFTIVTLVDARIINISEEDVGAEMGGESLTRFPSEVCPMNRQMNRRFFISEDEMNKTPRAPLNDRA